MSQGGADITHVAGLRHWRVARLTLPEGWTPPCPEWPECLPAAFYEPRNSWPRATCTVLPGVAHSTAPVTSASVRCQGLSPQHRQTTR